MVYQNVAVCHGVSVGFTEVPGATGRLGQLVVQELLKDLGCVQCSHPVLDYFEGKHCNHQIDKRTNTEDKFSVLFG